MNLIRIRSRTPFLLLLATMHHMTTTPAAALSTPQTSPPPPSSIADRIPLGSMSIAPLVLGTLRFPSSSNVDATTTEDKDVAVDILSKAPPFTLLDTAELYGKGETERCIGQAALAAGRTLGSNNNNDDESTLYIATKFAPGPLRFNSQSVVSACQESANRLGVSTIDLYQIHYADIVQPLKIFGYVNEKDEQYWQGLVDCVEMGYAKNVGVCNYGPTLLRRCYDYLSSRGVKLVSNQINFNLMRYRSSLETKRVCDELGIKVLAYHPIANGALTGKYNPEDPPTMPESQSKTRRMKWYLKGNIPLTTTLSRIATERQKSMAQVATNWVFCKDALPIAGPRNVEQTEDSLGSVDWMLSSGEVEDLDEASDKSVEYERGFVLD